MARSSGARARRKEGLRRPAADPAAAAYLVAVLLAGAQVAVLGDPGRTWRAAVPYLLGFLVVLTVRAVGPRDDQALVRWLHALSVAGVLLSMWLLGAFLGALPAGLGEEAGFYRVKVAVTSPVGDHNTAAGLLLPAIAASAAMAVRDPRWRLGLAVTTLGLVATLSRGAALVLLAVALLAWVVASDRRFKALLTVAGVAAVSLVLLAALLLGASPPGETDPGAEGRLGASVLGRVDLAARGLQVGIDEPLLGIGLGAFEDVAEDLPPPNDHAHQLLAQAFAEGGVILLGVAIIIPTLLARRTLALRSGPGRDVLLLGGAGLVAHAQLEILGGRVGYEVLLALLVALAAALHAGDRSDGHARSA